MEVKEIKNLDKIIVENIRCYYADEVKKQPNILDICIGLNDRVLDYIFWLENNLVKEMKENIKK